MEGVVEDAAELVAASEHSASSRPVRAAEDQIEAEARRATGACQM